MKLVVVAGCVLLSFAGANSAQGGGVEHQADRSVPAAPQLAFDPSTPLASRVILPPDSVLQRYRELPKPSPSFHELSEAERVKVESVLESLPAFSRQVLAQHVRSISFVDGIPNNATTIKEAGSGLPVFNIVLRAGLLNETVSEFLTRKESSYYSGAGSPLTLSVEAGSLPAVLYVLVHESVHVLDISNRGGEEGPPRLFPTGDPNQLVRGVWENASTKVPAYRSPLLAVNWFGSGKPEGLEAAEPTYRMLGRTPFVSLYGSSNWYDDAAELVTWYYMTHERKQPYRIVLRRGAETVYSLEPMDSALVQARLPGITALFD